MTADSEIGTALFDFFIAYAGPDRDVALALYEGLLPAGRVFIDCKSVRPGSDWDRALPDGIRASRIIVVLVSSHAERSYYERDEIRLALKLSQAEPERHAVVPVFLDLSAEEAGKRLYGIGLKQGLDAREAGLPAVIARLIALHAGPAPSPRPLRDLVDDLERILLERARHESDDTRTAAHTAEIDRLVRQVMERGRVKAGDHLAGTTLVKPVGSGNFGTIWLARRDGSGELAAVKVFHLEKLTEGVMLWRFRRSIRAMQRLNEDRGAPPSIVRVYEGTDDTLAFSMEYLSEGNLEEIASRGWTLDKKVEIFAEICRAVAFAHDKGVIHRDIKPANVVLNEQRKPVLTDFDIADIRFVTRLSVAKGGLGTPVFSAPEQLEEGDKATERADVYSLGRLLYYMLLERSPGYQVEADPSLDNLASAPPTLVAIVRRATQFDAAKRFPSVDAILAELGRYQSGWAAVRARLRATTRWMRKSAAMLIIFTLLVGGASGFALYKSGVAKREAENAERLSGLIEQMARWQMELKSLQLEKSLLRQEISSLTETIAEYDRRIAAAKGTPLEAQLITERKASQNALDTQLKNEQRLGQKLDALRRNLDESLKAAEAARHTMREPAPRGRKPAEAGVALAATVVEGSITGGPGLERLTDEDVGHVKVLCRAPYASLYINDNLVTFLPMEKPVPVAAGTVTLEVKAPGYLSEIRPVEVEAGDVSSEEFELLPVNIAPLVYEAQDEYVHGNYAGAIENARKALKSDPSNAKAWRIVGASSCFLKDKSGAVAAWNKLDSMDRQFLKYVCSRNAITIP